MTTVRQILRYARTLGQITEGGVKVLSRPVRCASTQTQQKIIEDGNGKKIFHSPYGEVTPVEKFLHEYTWKDFDVYQNNPALTCSVTGRRYTYSEARDAANYVGRSLLNMGLKKGDVVALIAPNYPDTILSFLGMLEADIVVTTVNPFYTVEEISRQLKNSGAKAIFTAAEIADVALAAAKGNLAPGSPIVVIEDGTKSIPTGTIPFKDLITKGKSLPPIKYTHQSVDDMVVLPYSSGTTGMPKGVVLSHKNLVANMQMVHQTTGHTIWKQSIGSSQEVVPLILPFFHIFGMNAIVLPLLSKGAEIITLPKFTPDMFINVLMSHKVTAMFVVPPILMFFNAHPMIKKEYLDNMHHAICGAAPLGQQDVDQFYERFEMDQDKLKFCQGYGLTETSPVCFIEVTGTKTGSIGRNIAGCDVRLVDPMTKKDVTSPRQSGEIWIRGPHVMKGYFKNEEATNEMMVENDWLRTGDIAYYDEDFDFYVTDRMKELIKVKGFQVAPAELEAILRTHPDVEEAAVIGIKDERCGEVPKAFVMVKDNAKASEEDVKNFLKGKVADYKELQGGVMFVDEIPKNPSGKILRMKLKQLYIQQT
ncbi:uncharacterized protein LOC143183762 [Calliopsis andreniformis]|uniref:uncharacterized protein LOC143183762 n=1 Tax=Calliopsis andreniformis TaxID=337506 RepID=UPI003FCD9C67